MPAGRPTKYKAEYAKQAAKLSELGATDREIADFFEVNEATVHRWKHTHPEFCESLKVGKEAADDRVEQALYRRALGYSHDAVKIINVNGVVAHEQYVEHYPPDTTAMIFWLKNRRKEVWRDKQEHGLTDKDGNDVPVTDTEAARRIAFVLASAARKAE